MANNPATRLPPGACLLQDGSHPLTANWDAGSFDIRAQNLTADALTAGRVLYTGANGLLSVAANFTWDASTLEIYKDAAVPGLALSCYHDTEATAATLTLRKADNTQASPALVDDNAVLGVLNFDGYDGSGWHTGAKIEARIAGTPSDGTDLPTELTFWTTPDASATPVQRMTILPSGNVGFMTDAPDQIVHIIDTSNPATDGSVIIEGCRDGLTNIMALRARDAGTPEGALPINQGVIIRFQGFDGADFENMGGIAVRATQIVADGDAPGYMSFHTSTDASADVAERARIDAKGNVYIGTTTIDGDAVKCFTIGNGTLPTSPTADQFYQWSADVGGVAGKAGPHFMGEEGGAIAFQPVLGTVDQLVYQNDALADNGTVNLTDATSGLVFVSCNAEAGMWLVEADGGCTKIAGSTNTADTESDTDLCVYDGGGTIAIVKNMLGVAGETRIIYFNR